VELERSRALIRIPPELDVPLTDRVRATIDTSAFRRLAGISQLGLVSLVYPAAHHRRFEHSLGVYRLSLLFLRQLTRDERFGQQVTREQAERFVVACLCHDIGHWPFCHLIEDLELSGVPRHEDLAEAYLLDDQLASVLRRQWGLEVASVAEFLAGECSHGSDRLLQSMLAGPIDVDKMDYLMRDSLHAGVPYGRNFDQARLIGSLCLNAAGDGLAITEKGRTAAEMLVFARYVMLARSIGITRCARRRRCCSARFGSCTGAWIYGACFAATR
jgi:HD superfamily phosphohydrolase